MLKLITASAMFALLLVVHLAHAGDSRCNAPPYGATEASYTAYVNSFGGIVPPMKLFSSICRAKYDNDTAARDTLHKLGIFDQQIDSEGVADLAVDVLKTIKNIADQVPVQPSTENDRPRIWAVLSCISEPPALQIPGQQNPLCNTTPMMGKSYFQSRTECEASLASFTHDADNKRFNLIENNGTETWFQCASKAVDAWEQ